jgi:hypothetical protein
LTSWTGSWASSAQAIVLRPRVARSLTAAVLCARARTRARHQPWAMGGFKRARVFLYGVVSMFEQEDGRRGQICCCCYWSKGTSCRLVLFLPVVLVISFQKRKAPLSASGTAFAPVLFCYINLYVFGISKHLLTYFSFSAKFIAQHSVKFLVKSLCIKIQ